MMRALAVCLALVATTSQLPAQSVKADYYLDAPGHTRTPSDGARAFFPGFPSMASTSHPPPTPLRLTLISVERTDFRYGEYFTYEVLLENISRSPVTIPWSPDGGAFVQPAPRMPAGFLSGSVGVQVESAGEPPQLLSLLDGQPLYGSHEVPRSLLVLAPGRTALIRAQSQWSASMPEGRDRILQQPDGAVRLRASFFLVPDVSTSARSTNTLPVRVAPFQVQ